MYVIDSGKLNYWQQIQENAREIEDLKENIPFITKRGTWSNEVQYNTNDLVNYSGSSYLAIVGNIGYRPDQSPDKWQLFAEKGASVVGASISEI